MASLNVQLIGFRVHHRISRDPAPLIRGDGSAYLLGNRKRNLCLKPKDVFHRAGVILGPEVFVPDAVNKLCRNPDFVADAEDRAFDNGVHVQLSRDIRD